MQIGKILGDCQDEDELDPFGRLEVLASRHFHPTSGTQIFLAEDHHHHERGDGSDVHPVHLIEERLIVDQTHHEHGSDAADNPVNLL